MTKFVVGLGITIGTLGLGGCMTAEDRVVFNDYYSRSQVDSINAEQQCKLLARNLVQISRCEVRR
jgi:hypothetical protein